MNIKRGVIAILAIAALLIVSVVSIVYINKSMKNRKEIHSKTISLNGNNRIVSVKQYTPPVKKPVPGPSAPDPNSPTSLSDIIEATPGSDNTSSTPPSNIPTPPPMPTSPEPDNTSSTSTALAAALPKTIPSPAPPLVPPKPTGKVEGNGTSAPKSILKNGGVRNKNMPIRRSGSLNDICVNGTCNNKSFKESDKLDNLNNCRNCKEKREERRHSCMESKKTSKNEWVDSRFGKMRKRHVAFEDKKISTERSKHRDEIESIKSSKLVANSKIKEKDIPLPAVS